MIQATSDVPQCDHLVSLLEAMAKAAWNVFWCEKDQWDTLSTHSQYAAIDGMRAGLIALAECAWPNDVSRLGRETLLTYGKTLDDASRAMLVAIASERAPEASPQS